MPGRATSHAISSNLNYVFRNQSYGLENTSWYLGLSLVRTKDRYDSPIEPKDTSYGRIAIPRDSSNWEIDEEKGVVYNSKEIKFNMATQHWGTVYEVFISDAENGNVWFTHSFDKPIHVIESSVLIFPERSLMFSRLEG